MKYVFEITDGNKLPPWYVEGDKTLWFEIIINKRPPFESSLWITRSSHLFSVEIEND